ncbi:MAG: pyruvate kinase alpha/beta domain-containing protein, partial [Candidatus Cloacimonadota bacterium]|nr:pyruvate kinase alpha/beta domain-containing protein [Candidatus Cloacimonadota bacterium]
AYQSKASAIIVFTKMGYSAKMISKLRPGLPIYAFTPSEIIYHQLAMKWGINPKLIVEMDNFEEMLNNAIDDCLTKDYLKKGDLIVIVAGLPLGVRGRTNMIRIESLGKNRIPCDVVNKGIASEVLIFIDNEKDLYEKDIIRKIVLLKKFRKEYTAKLKYVSGIVMESGDAKNDLQTVGFAFDIPIVINAKNASDILKEGTVVKIDTKRAKLIEV